MTTEREQRFDEAAECGELALCGDGDVVFGRVPVVVVWGQVLCCIECSIGEGRSVVTETVTVTTLRPADDGHRVNCLLWGREGMLSWRKDNLLLKLSTEVLMMIRWVLVLL